MFFIFPATFKYSECNLQTNCIIYKNIIYEHRLTRLFNEKSIIKEIINLQLHSHNSALKNVTEVSQFKYITTKHYNDTH